MEVADVNGDKKPDVIAVGGSTCAWYENPTWKKRVVTGAKETPGIISSATADLDGDGKAEIAIAYEFEMSVPTKGKLLLAVQGNRPDLPWRLIAMAEVPSIHRLRWGDVTGDGKLDLVVAPIFGRLAQPPRFEPPARLTAFHTDGNPISANWDRYNLADRPVIHAIEVRPSRSVGHCARSSRPIISAFPSSTWRRRTGLLSPTSRTIWSAARSVTLPNADAARSIWASCVTVGAF